MRMPGIKADRIQAKVGFRSSLYWKKKVNMTGVVQDGGSMNNSRAFCCSLACSPSPPSLVGKRESKGNGEENGYLT